MQYIRKQFGFTLIEVIVSIFVIMILTTGVYSLIIMAQKASNLNKMYVVAIELANQKMERIRNMPYDEVGVVSGIPSGTIPQVEIVDRDGEYTINTYVSFYDDPADGQAGSTTPDTIPTDYKIATVKVAWTSRFGDKDVSVFSKIVPRTVETNQGYGLLKISVRDSNAQPVPNASIRVVNNTTNPLIDVTNIANAMGELYLPATSSSESFQIMVNKTDLLPAIAYGQDQTYGTSTGKNPRHLTVTEGNMTEEEFQIDRLGTIRLRTVSSNLPDNWQANITKSGRSEHSPSSGYDGASSLYAAWQAEDATSSFVYVNRYDENGSRQWASDKRIGSSLSESAPDIAVLSGGGAFIVWQDKSIDLKKITLGGDSTHIVRAANSSDIRLDDKTRFAFSDFGKRLVEKITYLFEFVRRGFDVLGFYGASAYQRASAIVLALPDKLSRGLSGAWQTEQASAAGSIVQSIKVSGVVTLNSSASVSFTNPPTAGNMLIAIAIHENSNQAFTGVSNASGAFSQSVVSNVSFGLDVGIWHKVAGAGEPSSVTVTANGNLEGGVLMIMEVSGLDTANPINVIKTNDQTSGASKVATTNLSPVSTSNGFAVAAIAFADNDFNIPTSASWVSASANTWTHRNWTAINGSDDTSIGVATMDVSTAVAQRATLTVTGGDNEERNSVMVVYNLYDPDDVLLDSSGTQITSTLEGSANVYLGGAFRLSDQTGSRNVTGIRISENGTIDAAADFDNIKLFYDVDTSAPYDCASETYSGSESQFGATDTDGMSGPDGYSQMNGSVSISQTRTMCVYVVADIGIGADKDETIDLEISDPTTQVSVSSGTMIPSSAVTLSGTTKIDVPAFIRQASFRWRNDDGDEDGASWKADPDTALTVANNEQLRLRFSVANSGSLTDSSALRLEYGERVTSCSAIGAASWHTVPNDDSLDWRSVASANYVDDEATTQQIGSGAFTAATMEESSSQGPSVSLNGDTSTEIEFAISPTTNTGDLSYCFRLTDNGTALDAYDFYAEANVVGDDNIYIIKVDSNGNALWSAKRISSDDSSSNQIMPRIASIGSVSTATSVAVWQDDRSGNYDIYAQAFDALGNPLWNGGNDMLITASSSDEVSPTVAIDPSGQVIIAWTELGSLDCIFISKYNLDGSAAWVGPILGPISGFPISEPALATDASSSIYLAYTESMIGNPSAYLARYDSAGNLDWDTVANKDSVTGDRLSPSLAISANNAYVSWTDQRGTNRDIYGQKFDLAGNQLWSRDLLLGVTTSSSTQDKSSLSAFSGGRAFAFWMDERNVPTAVYGAEFIEPGIISVFPM
jgi:type II secretory pathway pseudopilin PulG